MKRKTTEKWLNAFPNEEFSACQIANMKDMVERAETKYRKVMVEVDQTGPKKLGQLVLLSTYLKHSQDVYAPVPHLGGHSDELLKNILGYSQKDIDLGVKIRNSEIKLEIAKKRFNYLFGGE